MSVKPIPDGYHTVTPYLIVKGAAPWVLKRFGFRTVLIANAILGGLFIVACAGFSVTTSTGSDPTFQYMQWPGASFSTTGHGGADSPATAAN